MLRLHGQVSLGVGERRLSHIFFSSSSFNSTVSPSAPIFTSFTTSARGGALLPPPSVVAAEGAAVKAMGSGRFFNMLLRASLSNSANALLCCLWGIVEGEWQLLVDEGELRPFGRT